jgi:uncharacterized protein YkwD
MLSHRASAAVLFPAAALAVALSSRPALAVGESIDGFPSWSERVMHAWANRARVDPQLEMTACGNACGEAACYKPIAPLYWDEKLNHAARFHSANMKAMNFFAHTSKCTLVQDIGALYPTQCDGAASCACVGGTAACSPTCTDFAARVSLFGASPSGEIIASPSDPDQAFYLWLYEQSASTQCAFSQSNGHRWLLLTGGPAVGFGQVGVSVGDFGGAAGTHKIPSGSHYPRQSDSVEAWANWFDGAGPQLASVDVDGTCQPMALTRGAAENGAYKADVKSVGSGCHRYFFLFKDSNGQKVTFPEAGSLGIGDESCADWDATRPAEGAGCGCVPACNGAQCGDDGCGGTCGTCDTGSSCQGGQCVAESGSSSSGGGAGQGSGGGVGPAGGGGSSDGAGGNATPGGGDDDGSCSCRLAVGADAPESPNLFAILAAPLAAAALRLRRIRASSRSRKKQ